MIQLLAAGSSDPEQWSGFSLFLQLIRWFSVIFGELWKWKDIVLYRLHASNWDRMAYFLGRLARWCVQYGGSPGTANFNLKVSSWNEEIKKNSKKCKHQGCSAGYYQLHRFSATSRMCSLKNKIWKIEIYMDTYGKGRAWSWVVTYHW